MLFHNFMRSTDTSFTTEIGVCISNPIFFTLKSEVIFFFVVYKPSIFGFYFPSQREKMNNKSKIESDMIGTNRYYFLLYSFTTIMENDVQIAYREYCKVMVVDCCLLMKTSKKFLMVYQFL